jgi:hypothetical protein
VQLAVPIEAVRQAAVDKPRTVAGEGDRAQPVVVVDGVPASAKPAVGWKVGSADGATLWVKSVPAWAKDAPHAKATGAKDGKIAVTLPAEVGAGTLYLIVTP